MRTFDPNRSFNELRMIAGLSPEECAKLFEVNIRTIRNWQKGKKPPKAVMLFLQLRIGDLSFLGKKWIGFRLSNDAIEAPNGDFIYHYEVYAMRYLWLCSKGDRATLSRTLQQRFASERAADKPRYGSLRLINLSSV